jgi:hypothetical protein
VLRLWTESFLAGVFPDTGWLVKAGGKEISRYAGAEAQQSVLDGVDLLLHEKSLSARAGIDLVVSDSQARVLYLPWQNKLSSEAQREVYARGCFEQAGLVLEGDWLVQTAYRWYQGGGIAYCLPRALVASVADRLAASRLQLRSIMPLSAHAYWYAKGIPSRGRSVLYLEEQRRCSALLFGDRKCIGMHVQPGNSGPDTTKRLLRTIDAVFPEVGQMQVWSVHDDCPHSALFRELVPNANVAQIDKGRWG